MIRKTKLVFSIIIILTAIISASLGYFAAYVRGMFNMYHADGMNSCLVLFEQSRTLVSNIDSSEVNVNGLIDAIERSGDDWAQMAKAWQPHCRVEDRKTYSKALERWETAKKSLKSLGHLCPIINDQ